jgi:hypothetical protein
MLCSCARLYYHCPCTVVGLRWYAVRVLEEIGVVLVLARVILLREAAGGR